MRVITGTARGKRLKTLDGQDVRPTTDRVKEAVFSIIQFQTEGRVFLDLFAGSGQMGIEALSRKAKQSFFIDQSKTSLSVVKQNVQTAGFAERASIIQADAPSFLAGTAHRFDIAYLDPPFHSDLLARCLPLLAPKMNKGGIILCETTLDTELPQEAGAFSLHKEYR